MCSRFTSMSISTFLQMLIASTSTLGGGADMESMVSAHAQRTAQVPVEVENGRQLRVNWAHGQLPEWKVCTSVCCIGNT